MILYALTFAGPRGRCGNPSLKGPADVNVSEKYIWLQLLHKNVLKHEYFGENASKSSFFLYI